MPLIIKQEMLDNVADLMNNTPRKVLGFKTPLEIFVAIIPRIYLDIKDGDLNKLFYSKEQQDKWWQMAQELIADNVLELNNDRLLLNQKKWFQADTYTLKLMIEKP